MVVEGMVNLGSVTLSAFADDVINGYVTRQGAERHYGVVLCDDFSVDEEATRERRQAMQTEAM